MEYAERELLDIIKDLPDFKEIPSDYWIIGIRNHEDTPDKFDDKFYLMKGEKLILDTSGTTNPGVKILKGGFKKFNSKGAAVVQANRIYYNLWIPGLHRGKVEALRQQGALITIFRDGNGNGKSEEIGPKTNGYYGINFHPDQYNIYGVDKESDRIGAWSAGCQVCNDMKAYKKIIKLTKGQRRVTYALLKEFSV